MGKDDCTYVLRKGFSKCRNDKNEFLGISYTYRCVKYWITGVRGTCKGCGASIGGTPSEVGFNYTKFLEDLEREGASG